MGGGEGGVWAMGLARGIAMVAMILELPPLWQGSYDLPLLMSQPRESWCAGLTVLLPGPS